jgi:hypothetical protein
MSNLMTSIHSGPLPAPQFGKLTNITVQNYGQSKDCGDFIELSYQGKNENGTPYQGQVFHDQFYYSGEHTYAGNNKAYRFDLSSPTPFQAYNETFPETSPEVLADMKQLRQTAAKVFPKLKALQARLQQRLNAELEAGVKKILAEARKGQ